MIFFKYPSLALVFWIAWMNFNSIAEMKMIS